MRVCHVSPHLPPDQAANALLPASLGAWAADRGDVVTFVAHEPAQGGQSRLGLPGRVWLVPRRSATSRIDRLLRVTSLRQAKAITAVLDEAARGVDLLHIHSNGLIVEVAAAWAVRHGVPFVLTLYGTEIWHYRKRWPFDPFTRAYRSAAEVTFYSGRLLERARERGLDRPCLRVVFPAVRPAFAPLDAGQRAALRAELGITEALVALNVKRLHELAGQRYLIDAFAKVARARTDVRLVICGTGALRQPLEDQARDAGVLDRMTFTGLVSNNVVAKYAAVADLFVLPSLLEALPTVAVEALAAGTPVLSADHPGGEELHEIFDDDVRVVPRHDVDALAAGMAEAFQAPRRVRWKTAALVEQHFSPSAVQAAYDAVYIHALGYSRLSPP